MRSWCPPRILKRCNKCLRSVSYVLAEKDGRKCYVCCGTDRRLSDGCGHIIYLKDGAVDERIENEQC